MGRRSRCWKRLRGCEPLEPRYLLSASVFIEHHVVSDERLWMVEAADVDTDGDADIVRTMGSGIGWHENTDGRGAFADLRILIPFSPGELSAPCMVDIDGDGDVDALTLMNDRLVWFENTDSHGTFGGPRDIAPYTASLHYQQVVDFDRDGDIDIISPSGSEPVTIQWYENAGKAEGFYLPVALVTVPADFVFVHTEDIDGDGDSDLLVSSLVIGSPSADDSFKTAWYENLDGRGSFGEEHVIETPVQPRIAQGADLDSDNDVDVLANGTNRSDGWIQWRENTDGLGHFGERRPIAEGIWSRGVLAPVKPIDVDGDGDIDVIASQHWLGVIVWFENANGQGDFLPAQAISVPSDARSFASLESTFDMGGDGDIDVLFNWATCSSTSSCDPIRHLVWCENRRIGDANDDGVFDSSDMVKVFAAGKYEDGIPGNATFDEGDWNQDGDFDSSDLVLAFQTGLYEVKSLPDASDVAAAVDRLFAQDQRPGRPSAYVA